MGEAKLYNGSGGGFETEIEGIVAKFYVNNGR